MSKVYDFLKECGVYYVLTIDDAAPSGRPFGAIMEHMGCLYISTANTKSVYRQLIQNSRVQIIALKAETRDWIRISGNAIECKDSTIKQKMLIECPALRNHFTSADCEYFALFRIDVRKSFLNTDNGVTEIK